MTASVPTVPGPVLVMAGGTGGHVYPALAVAESLRAQGAAVAWLGTAAGLEARVVPAAGFPLHTIRVQGLRGGGLRRWGLGPFLVLLAVLRCLRLLARIRPALVLGMGGYAAGPGGVAARVLRRPLVVHEQNAVAGLTNRLLAPVAARVLEGFPGAFPAARRAVFTGNPVRADIAGLPEPGTRMASREGPLRILVLGGSQGAAALNETVPRALARLPAPGMVEVLHQCGERHREATAAAYRDAGRTERPRPFIEDMAAAYGWADLVLARAGAMTVSEIAAAGVGSILVPYPHAVDDHQRRNAHYLEGAGAALVIDQSALRPEGLAEQLAALAADRPAVLRMARAARGLARADATERVVEICREVARA